MNFLTKFAFWRKFSRHLLVGISAMILLAFFQTAQVPLFAAACTPNTAQPSTSINSPANNYVFPLGTTNVTVSWNPVNIDGETYRVTTTNNNSGAIMPGQTSSNYTGTSIDIPTQNGNSYTVLVIPQNSCGSSSSAQVSFSVGSTVTSCPNAGQCVTCGSGDDYEQVCAIPQNNCTPTCQGGTTGQINCSIGQQNNGGNLYTLTGNPNTYPYQNYNWDLDNNLIYNDAQGQTIQRSINPGTLVRLQVRDAYNNTGVCSITINPSGTSGDVPTCYITPANPSSQTSPYSVNFTGNAQAPSGRYITTYHWDFNGDGNFDSSSQNASWPFYNSSNVRLHVIDSAGRDNNCYTYVTVGSTSGGQCDQTPYYCPGTNRAIYKDPSRSCNYDYNQCNTSGGTCSQDSQRCSDGSYVYRNPSLGCQFNACSTPGSGYGSTCILGGPGVASYPGYPGSYEWCSCAQRNNDVGSLMNYSCPQAPTGQYGGPARQCNDLARDNAVCGQRGYTNCTALCNGTRAYYHCVAPENNQCQGDIYCNTEDSRCGGGSGVNIPGAGQISCPAGTSPQSIGNNQSTTICMVNFSENTNTNTTGDNINTNTIGDIINTITNTNTSSSYATGGGAGSATVNLTW